MPAFYWTGETEMNCLRECITATRRNAYAHHIQRLMLTGNFALLAGIAPAQVEECMPYRTLARMTDERRWQIVKEAQAFLTGLSHN